MHIIRHPGSYCHEYMPFVLQACVEIHLTARFKLFLRKIIIFFQAESHQFLVCILKIAQLFSTL
jgi:hypothetical protein